MQRLNSVNPELAVSRTKELLDVFQQTFGVIPNTARVMANSPAVLEGYLSFSQAMGKAKIGEKLHTQTKLATSESNACDYCTSFLNAAGPSAGLTPDDILAGRTASAQDERTDAALKFARAVLEHRGKVTGDQLKAMRDVRFDDAQIVEIVASVVLGCFTNFLNNVADTELDIPRAEAIEACSTDAACGCSV